MRKPHYWRKSSSKPSPQEVIIVDTETWHGDRARVEGGELHRLRLGCALAYRMERGKRTRQEELDFTDADTFWALVNRRLSKHRTLWIVGHNLAYDLGILNGWKWLTCASNEVERSIIEGGILYITGAYNGMGYILCDTFNWYKCSLESIGEANGIPKMPMPSQDQDNWDWYEYCRRDVQATAAGFDSLARYVRENELGPFQPTIASLAFSAYRHRFMNHKVLVHSCAPALELERHAYYGGIVATPLIGREVAGPITECDVVSMYPHACSDDLPYQFTGLIPRPTVTQVQHILKANMVIADVQLSADDATYPVRRRQNVYHCAGRYRTVLADAEFRRAWLTGSVTHVYTLCRYKAAPIFCDYMSHFATQKAAMRAAGRKADELIAKYLMNSLYGKTGQMSPRWVEWNGYAMELIETEYGMQPGTLAHRAETPPIMYLPESVVIWPEHGITLPVRQYFGAVEVAVGRAESRDSCPAIAACVTSRARVQLQTYHTTAGPREWFYSDTDSVWVSATGLERLRAAGMIRPGELGFLNEEKTVDRLIVHGRKDYEHSVGKKIKGVKKHATTDDGITYSQVHFPSAKTQLAEGPWGAVYVREAVKTLRRNVDWCHVGIDGWTQPFTLPQDEAMIAPPR